MLKNAKNECRRHHVVAAPAEKSCPIGASLSATKKWRVLAATSLGQK